MLSPKIFITQHMPDEGRNRLIEKFGDDAVEYNNKSAILPKKELIKRLKGKNVVLSLFTDKLDEEVFSSCPDLKMIANCAIGYNNIDIQSAKKHGIKVSNVAGSSEETTADFAFTLLMAISRRLVEGDKYMRALKYQYLDMMRLLGKDIYGSTLGIIGMGNIGKNVARRGAKGFNMNILYTDEIEQHNLDFEAEKVELEELLKKSDFVSLHVPLLQSTRHLIGEKQLALMKETAYLINTARGPVVDEKALYEALKNNKIAGAALDVFEEEPKFYPGLEKLDNVIMTPHIGSATVQARQRMSLMAAENIIDWAEGREPRTWVNK